jgi:hypothetical protein
MIFGPAMLDAYRMECKEARNPMVLVSEEVRSDARAAG